MMGATARKAKQCKFEGRNMVVAYSTYNTIDIVGNATFTLHTLTCSN